MRPAKKIALCLTLAAATLTATAQQQPKSPVTITPSPDSAAPHNAAAGQRAGEYIKAKARSDHGQLLYAIVDASIRRVGTPAAANK